MKDLIRSTPESQGVRSAEIEKYIRILDQLDAIHSVMILRHGQVIAEGYWAPYAPEYYHELFSTSKSFVSITAGILEAEGKLSLQDRVADYFREFLPENPGENLLKMRICDLLTMRSGHKTTDVFGTMELDPDGNYPRGFLAHEVEYEPGTHFVYDSSATYMVAAIIRKITGKNVLEILQEKVFPYIGIRAERWDCDPKGTNLGGWGFWLKTEDLARFGQLLLQKGRWEGHQLIPEDYIERASSKQADNSMNDAPDWKAGYGYQFWRCVSGAFRGDGAFGQLMVVMPEKDMVVAITAGMHNMQNGLTPLWELAKTFEDSALPEDPEAQKSLTELLSSLSLPLAEGKYALRNGRFDYELKNNPVGIDELSLFLDDTGCSVLFTETSGRTSELCAGYGELLWGELPFDRSIPRKTASSAAWQDENTLVIRAFFYETPYCKEYIFKFDGERLALTRKSNLLFREQEWPVLEGTLLP